MRRAKAEKKKKKPTAKYLLSVLVVQGYLGMAETRKRRYEPHGELSRSRSVVLFGVGCPTVSLVSCGESYRTDSLRVHLHISKLSIDELLGKWHLLS